MSRWIDADKLKRKMQRIATEAWKMKLTASVESVLNQFIDYINSAPSIDIVRCRECKHGKYREDHDDYLCRNDGICVHDADWFCADGERNSK